MARSSVINVLVNADPRKFVAGMKDAEGALGKLGGAAKNAAKMVGLAAGAFAGATAVLGKKAVDAASDFGESVNAVNVVFGEASEGILKLADDSARAVGLSSTEFNGFAVQFAGFTKQIAGSEGDIVEVTDELTTRIADFASVMNLDVPEAAAVFQSTLAGQTEPIRRFGIDMSAAAIEAFALEQGIWDGIGTMTESEKVMARYEKILEDTSAMSGDFANTSDSLANMQRILGAEFENAQVKLGQFLLPAVEDLVSILLERGIPALNDFIDYIGPKLETSIEDTRTALARVRDRYSEVRDAADEMAASIRDRVTVEFERGKKFVEEYNDELALAAGAIGGIAGALIAYQTAVTTARTATGLLTIATTLLNIAMGLNPFVLIFVAIAALVGLLVVAYYKFESVRDIVHAVWDAIKTAAEVVWEFVQTAWAALLEALDLIKPAIDTVVELFYIVRDAISSAISDAVDAVKQNLGPLAGWFQDNVVDTIAAAVEFFITLFQKIVDFLRPLLSTLVDILSAAIETMVSIIVGFVDYIRPLFEIFWEALKTIVVVAFEAIENVVEIALAVIRGLFEAGTALLKGDFGAVWDALKGIVVDALAAIWDFVSTFFGELLDFLKGLPEKIGRATIGMFDGIKNAFKEAINFVIRGWNALEFRVPGFSIGPIGYDGFTLGVPDIPLLADGGIVNRPTLAVIGEAGPEAVVPLDRAKGGIGGNTYNISVQAGVGDPGTIGQAVVDAIAAYERRNGAGWRAA
jgi:phage-related protein